MVEKEKSKKKFLLLNGSSKKVLERFPSNTFHTVVTSPPYWQLRDYFVDGQLGNEATPEEYVENLVDILREVKRTLRKDGNLWLNLGDGYNNSSGFCRARKKWKREGRTGGSADKKVFRHDHIKQKDLIGIPWAVAFALQKDGWYLRCDIIYSKTNPMPDGAKDRPTRSHEYIFLLSKSHKYFYDYYAVLEDTESKPKGTQGFGANNQEGTFRMDQNRIFEHYGKRNKRSVWTTSVSSFKGKHFATFPQDLINPCVCASTSEKGCCVKCGTPWVRDFEKIEVPIDRTTGKRHTEIVDIINFADIKQEYDLQLIFKGWNKSCDCDTEETKPCLVLDPFSGMATTGLAAFKYNQHYVGIELNKEYLEMSRDRLMGEDTMSIEEISTVEEILNAY